jgi:hypothetical protein
MVDPRLGAIGCGRDKDDLILDGWRRAKGGRRAAFAERRGFAYWRLMFARHGPLLLRDGQSLDDGHCSPRPVAWKQAVNLARWCGRRVGSS